MTTNDPNNLSINNSTSYQNIPKIRVIVRKRPLSKKETLKNDTDIVDIRNNKQVIVKELKTKVDLTKYIEEHSFTFDQAFNENATNEQIYLSTVRPMIEAAFHKTKVTCFAYGQTGSGKTFTMMGNTKQIPGLYLLAAYDIFSILQNYNNFSIWVSFYEIYCGKLFDLLNDRKVLTAREDGKQNIVIKGLIEKNVLDLNFLMQIIEYGINARTVGVTGANADSSRSHGIIQITIKDHNMKQHGKITFIDLAGSERAADTIDVNKQTKFDGAEINKSLLALKECIRALDQDKKHTPFRGSKLTLVLRDSFIGNCKTLMIANISPALGCSEHTLNTLRYADRVKELRAKPDIKIGQGNVNLNSVNNNNCGKGCLEDLCLQMMMPRMHNNTVKYVVDGNMQKVKKLKSIKKNHNNNKDNSFNNNSDNKCVNIFANIPSINSGNNNNFIQSQCNNFPFQRQISIPINNNGYINNNNIQMSEQKSQIINMNNCYYNNNDLCQSLAKNVNNYQLTENKENLQTNNNNYQSQQILFTDTKSEIREQQQMYEMQTSDKKEKNENCGNMGFAFLNDYTSFKDSNNNKDNNNKLKELNELKEKYEKIVNDILIEEKNCLCSHKNHIDEMVMTMKNEMNLINVVEQRSNVDDYVNQMLNIFSTQENKIQKMKEKLLGFKNLLKEENELSDKLNALTERNNNRNEHDEGNIIETNIQLGNKMEDIKENA